MSIFTGIYGDDATVYWETTYTSVIRPCYRKQLATNKAPTPRCSAVSQTASVGSRCLVIVSFPLPAHPPSGPEGTVEQVLFPCYFSVMSYGVYSMSGQVRHSCSYEFTWTWTTSTMLQPIQTYDFLGCDDAVGHSGFSHEWHIKPECVEVIQSSHFQMQLMPFMWAYKFGRCSDGKI